MEAVNFVERGDNRALPYDRREISGGFRRKVERIAQPEKLAHTFYMMALNLQARKLDKDGIVQKSSADGFAHG